jgi:hypothetical protein
MSANASWWLSETEDASLYVLHGGKETWDNTLIIWANALINSVGLKATVWESRLQDINVMNSRTKINAYQTALLFFCSSFRRNKCKKRRRRLLDDCALLSVANKGHEMQRGARTCNCGNSAPHDARSSQVQILIKPLYTRKKVNWEWMSPSPGM